MIEFADPKWLTALWALPVVVALFVYGSRRRAAELRAFSGSDMHESLAPGASWRKTLLKNTLKTLGIALLIVALARPQFGRHLVKVEREGIDLVIALDTSLSMLAEDMKPNRLERAKQEIVDLIAGLSGDRVGVVAFAGDAFVLCPLTVDYDAALMFTQTADVDIVSKPGTALHRAIEKSISLFPTQTRSDQVIILVTDGEGHDGDPVALARDAKAKGIRIYTIGIGNPKGELIPLRSGGAISGYKKDRAGETVLTRLDEKTLREIAHLSDGKYLPATRQGLELKVLYREISGLQKSTIEGEFVERKRDRFVWFVGMAFVLLALEMLLSRRGVIPRDGRRLLHTGVRLLPLVLCGLLAGDAVAADVDRGKVKAGNEYYGAEEYNKALLLYEQALTDSLRRTRLTEGLHYNQANALHMLGKYDDALKVYNMGFSEDSVQVGRLLYNRATTFAKMGNPAEAAKAYVQGLRFLPNDEDARHNLELALLQLREQQQQQQQNQDQQNQDQQENNEQQNQNQQNQDQQNQDQQNQDQQDPQQPDSTQTQPQEPDSSQVDQQQQPNQPVRLSREDAMRILQLLEEREKELQKARRKAAFKRVSRRGKDW